MSSARDCVGGSDCWGEGAVSDNRWRTVMTSECQEGTELRRVWDKVQGQAREASQWLDLELAEVFKPTVEGVGQGSCSGETRSRKVVEIEKVRSHLLTRCLELYRPRTTRVVWAWRQRDKISCS